MKKAVITFITIVLPLFMFATSFNLGLFKTVFPKVKMDQRTWRVSEKLAEYYDGVDWQGDNKMNYFYSAEFPTKIDSVWVSYYDIDLMDWNHWVTYRLQYEASHEYITQIEGMLTYMGLDFPMFREYISYDNQHRLTVADYMEYDPDNMIWMETGRTQIVYISNVDYTVYSYSANEDLRAVYNKINFQWDGQGRIITELEQSSPDSVNWTNSSKTNRTYHPHDTLTGDVFVSNIAHMLPMSMIMEDVPAFGMVSTETYQYWDGVSAWVDSDRDTYTYDANDKLIQKLSEYYEDNSWSNNEKYVYQYDTNGNLDYEYDYYWDWDLNDWFYDYRYDYTWENTSANDDNIIPSISPFQITVYPNPFKDGMNIATVDKSDHPVKINVYNLKGQLIRHYDTKTNNTILWDGRDSKGKEVSTGMYFIKAVGAQGSKTVKVMRMK